MVTITSTRHIELCAKELELEQLKTKVNNRLEHTEKALKDQSVWMGNIMNNPKGLAEYEVKILKWVLGVE